MASEMDRGFDFDNFYQRKPMSAEVIQYVRSHYFLEPKEFAQFLHEEISDEHDWYAELVRYYRREVRNNREKKRLWCEWVELQEFTSMWFNYMNYEYSVSKPKQ